MVLQDSKGCRAELRRKRVPQRHAEQVTSLGQVVCGFSDTLDTFKDCLAGKKSYAQEKLYGDFIAGTYSAHNALADVKALQELVSKSNLHHPVVTAGFTFESAVGHFEHQLDVPMKNHNWRSTFPLCCHRA